MKTLKPIYYATKTISDITYKVSNILATFLLGVIFVLILYAIVMRYVFLLPPIWSDELPRYIAIWMVFFAASSALRLGEHVGLSILIQRLPSGFAAVVFGIVNLVLLSFVLLMIWQGFLLTFKFSVDQQSSSLGISMIYPMISVPIGGILMAVHLVHNIIKILYTGESEAADK